MHIYKGCDGTDTGLSSRRVPTQKVPTYDIYCDTIRYLTQNKKPL